MSSRNRKKAHLSIVKIIAGIDFLQDEGHFSDLSQSSHNQIHCEEQNGVIGIKGGLSGIAFQQWKISKSQI